MPIIRRLGFYKSVLICGWPKTHYQILATVYVNKCTWLGLSISRQIIVENHIDSLICESVLGEGTEFIISIPISGK
jgi:light-regulated signal transduction histidine kinase (bacteriophytochrome)